MLSNCREGSVERFSTAAVKRFGIAVAAMMCAAVALACADSGYDMSWDPKDSSAILSPSNDTRANLILLLSDRDGTRVADPAQMAKGIVPFDFPYRVMIARMSPPGTEADPVTAYEAERAQYGLSGDGFDYFGYRSDNIGLCRSNRSGSEQFDAALTADASVPAGEKTALTDARARLATACDKAPGMRFALDSVTSTEGRAFVHYVEGARLFYAEDFAAANEQFAAVGPASSAWLRETSDYMRFRTALAAALKRSLGEWGDLAEPDKRDHAAIDRADELRHWYLQAWQNGRYANSARNLERRVAWLRDDRATLAAAYSTIASRKGSPGAKPDIALIDEFDRRFLPSTSGAGITEPDLLAVMDLMRLRPTPEYGDRSCCGPKLTKTDLERQRDRFRMRPDLFGYLQAAEAYWHRHQPQEVLALIPDAARQRRFSYVQFSRQMLRGFALEELDDPNARAFWLSLLPGAIQPYQRAAVELAILRHDRAAGIVGRLLETGSPVLHPLLRQSIIEEDAGPDLLRRQAAAGATRQQRDVALYILLADELHHGRYRDFLADQSLVGSRPQPANDARLDWIPWKVQDYDPRYQLELSPPPLYVFASGGSDDLEACPNIRKTAQDLAADSAAIHPRLCLAEFIRRKGLDGWNRQFDGKEFVSQARNHFPGAPLERMDIYLAAIASADANTDDKAFALNRAIRCYQPAGISSCGLKEVPKSIRRDWFQMLKTRYAGTHWARELKYYW
jgi:hypothetical protein